MGRREINSASSNISASLTP
ncbi:hypothetical protein D037_4855A, partial [Vibrio parahaemolyticus IDH02640]